MTNSLTMFSIIHNHIHLLKQVLHTAIFGGSTHLPRSHPAFTGWQGKVGRPHAASTLHPETSVTISGWAMQAMGPFSGSDLGRRRPRDTSQGISTWLIQSERPDRASQVERKSPRCLGHLTPLRTCSWKKGRGPPQ